jgi:hypothetical protein
VIGDAAWTTSGRNSAPRFKMSGYVRSGWPRRGLDHRDDTVPGAFSVYGVFGVCRADALTIATMPARTASGSRSHASTTAVRSGQLFACFGARADQSERLVWSTQVVCPLLTLDLRSSVLPKGRGLQNLDRRFESGRRLFNSRRDIARHQAAVRLVFQCSRRQSSGHISSSIIASRILA